MIISVQSSFFWPHGSMIKNIKNTLFFILFVFRILIVVKIIYTRKNEEKIIQKWTMSATLHYSLIQIVNYSPYTSRTSWAWTQCPGLRLGRGRGRGAARTSPTSTTPRSTGAGAKHKGGYDVHAAYIEKDYHV